MDEKEYIEREALQEIFENRMQDNNIMCPVIKVLDVIEIIEKQPTADVVEVVRCKDCKRFVVNKEAHVTYCNRELKHLFASPDDYCSYGERKDG